MPSPHEHDSPRPAPPHGGHAQKWPQGDQRLAANSADPDGAAAAGDGLLSPFDDEVWEVFVADDDHELWPDSHDFWCEGMWWDEAAILDRDDLDSA
jgi:hypothetical protein